MLIALGLMMIATFTFLIMTNRMSTITALTLVPVFFALLGGFGLQVPEMMLNGMKKVAPAAAFLLFALLFFATMIDAGLFDPLIKKILKWVKCDPVKIAVGTSVLTLSVALDGDGVTTFLIVTTAMLPLYRQARMHPATLATIATISFSVMSGMTPWGGPAARAMSVLNVSQAEYFGPFLPTMILACAWVILVAYILGRLERRGILKGGVVGNSEFANAAVFEDDPERIALQRPRLYWINMALTIATMGTLIADVMPSASLFLLAFVIALMINYPTIAEQKKRLKAHSGSALLIVAVVLVGGSFTGILSETHMVDALAAQLVSMVPTSWSGLVPAIIALVSIPFSFVMSNDAYFFGVVPVLAKAAEAYNVTPVEVIRAAVLAQPVHFILPLVPSTIVLLGATQLDLKTHIRCATPWSVLTCLVFIVLAIVTGSLSFNL
ncbi:CitMHS family transporter [Pseudomonas taiwanensis]|uniref:Damage-inducible protein CinA n=1 Tax=Pseudomonas taiwanensis TaxID=470150 RepID=A0ABR6V7Z3_9PSED|nr:citrate:proton symporter [Pseudomonas taiwanensis]MBC3476670.1 damage-inducible protein CinA [Pseudomonas taiwanensis]